MKTKITFVFILLITQFIFSQKKSRADRFFTNGDYINAALQYEEELNEEGYEKHILENISISYYNTFQFKKAYRYLKVLTSGKFYGKDKSYDNSYNFMMHQVLSSLGKYEMAVDFLALYKSNNETNTLDKLNAISTIEAFKLKDDDYVVKSVAFNTESSEFGAVKLDSTIYFTSDRSSHGFMNQNYKWTHRPFLDIYAVKVDNKNVEVSEIEALSGEVNSKLHEGNFCFTSDGNTIYFSKSNSEKGKKKFDSLRNNAIHLYKAIKVDGIWQTPEKLKFNNKEYSIEHPSVSADDKTLYFSSNMPGGFGDFDIYTSEIKIDGTYGEPINLGASINTKNREQFPYISKEGHLFFSSNGHLGLGMMDVFVSELKDKVFTKPVNLGAPINSSYDDFSLTYYNEKDGFFASNRKGKTDDDIYAFSQIGEIFLKEYVTNFEVRDFATDNYVPNAAVVLQDVEKKMVYENRLDSIASFSLSVFPGKYDFKASSVGYKTNIKPILVKEKENERYVIYLEKEPVVVQSSKDQETGAIVTSENDRKKRKEEITAEELRLKLLSDNVGPPVIEKNGKLYFDLPPIYFDYDKWNIRADSKKVLDEFALKLEKYKTVYIKISSHTDSRGTDSYNQVLSEKRAESTRNYLALIGYVNARRMQFEGFGESAPLIDCNTKTCTEDDHQINRRSEFEITKY
ncbi:Outer membrane protein OmpA [Aquimarina amphilecti]|uniref:Outer membrane protein OmpA n=1 Tax=Aquimarina amphilecti TaxID=1038014 RepID=A0A1H7GHI7_AQUAM|nr:OmpA family protein [Aquimarina amphilecti]SEK35285.1 Outer membrane protein OmpA [Aquimarina amphilecti]